MSSKLGHATSTQLPLPKPLFFSLSTEDGPDNAAIIQITSPAHTLDLLWLAPLLSLAINFNQMLCTLLYSCLKPSQVLLLLRKPLPVILHSSPLPPSLPFPLPMFALAPRGNPGTTVPFTPSYLGVHKKSLQPELVPFKVWPSLPRPII